MSRPHPNRKKPAPGEDKSAPPPDLATLIRRVEEAEAALQAHVAAAGQVDAIVDQGGRPLLLQAAQSALISNEATQRLAAETLASILNALPAHIALLDAEGVILTVNESWKRFAAANVLNSPAFGVGSNYLEVCERATGACSEEAGEAGRGLRRVLRGEAPEYSLEYPCHSPTEQRWFRLMVTPVSAQHRSGVVVMHINITERRQAEEALRKSEEQFARAFAFAAIGMALVAPTGRYLKVNRALCTILGYTEAELLARSYHDVTHPEDRDDQGNVARLLAGEIESFQMEKRYLHRNGRVVWGGLSASVVRDAAGHPMHLIAQIQDITERKKDELELRVAERAARESEARLGFALEAADIGDWSLDLRTNVAQRSLRHDKCFGYSDALPAWGYNTFLSHVHPLDRDRIDACFKKAMAGLGEYDAEFRTVWPDGSMHWLWTKGRFYFDEAKSPHRVAGIVSDITARKQVELTLRESETRFRETSEQLAKVLDSSLDVICTIDETGRFTQVSAASERVWGYRPEELIGRPFIELVHPDDQARTRAIDAGILSGTVATNFENRYVRKDGSTVYIRWSSWWSAEDRSIFCVAHDNTQAHLANEALQVSNEQFHQLVDNISDAFWVRSPDMSRVEYLSPAFEKIWGRPRETLLAAPGQWAEFIFPEDREMVRTAFARLMREAPSVDLEYRIVWPAGEIRWVRVRGFQVRDPAGRLIRLTGIASDISDRKQAEAQLRLLETSVAHLNDIVVITEAEPIEEPGPRIVYVNEAFVRLTGYSREEAIGRSPRFLQGPKTSPATRARIREALRLRRPVREEIINYSKTGREYWLEVEIVPVTDEQGRVTHAIAIERDITERKLADEALRNNEALLRMASEVSRLGAWRVELPSRRMLWSEEVSAIHETPRGFAPSVEQGIEFYAPEHRERIREVFGQCVTTGKPFDEELQIITAKGERRWVRVLGEAGRDEAGRIAQAQGTIQDITERKMAEARLHREESLMELAGKVSKVAGWSLTEPDMKLYWSRQVWEMVDYPPDQQPVPDELLQYYLPDSRKKLSQAITRCAKNGKAFDLELQLTTPAGRAMWVRVAGEPDYDAKGRIQAVHGAFSDITARKAAEQELRRTNRALQLLTSCNEVLIRAEQENELFGEICRIAVEQGGYRMAWVGFARDDESRTIAPVAHAGVEAGYLTEIKVTWDENQASGRGPAGQVIRSGRAVVCEDFSKEVAFEPWFAMARERGYSGVICLPLHEAGRTFGLLGLYTGEVTHTGAEELKLLQELADDVAFGVLNLRARLERRRTHEAVLAMARGISASSGSEFFDRLTHSMVEALGAYGGYVCNLASSGQKTARTLSAVVDGRTVPNFEFALAGTPGENLESKDDWIVSRDAQRLYPQTAANLAALGIEASVGTKLHDVTGRVIGLMFVIFRQPLEQTEFVVSTLRIFAARAAAELARNEAELKTREQAALIDEARDAIILRDLQHRITFWSRGAERLYGWTPAEALGRSMAEVLNPELEKFHEAIGLVLRDGAWAGEIRKTTRDNQTVTVDARWTLLRDTAGQPKSILAIDTDITERKKLEQQFLRAQRMESIGTLAGGIAHDLNNLLAPITMGVDLLKLFEPNPKSLPVIENIERSAKRGADLVKQVLSFARGVEGARVALQVRHILKEVESIAANTFPKNITVETHLPRDLWTVLADPTQLNQVVMNLCVNARDAMPNGGRLEVTASNAEIDAQYAAMNQGMAPGRYVVIQVTDTGIGMPQSIIDRIFEPFFTTKELGKGTGLGLSTVLGIVRSHGGFVNVYSEVGRGSTFKVYLPAHEAGAGEAEDNHVPEPLPRGSGELILVVDDETSILDITKQTLQAFGYRVVTAEDGAQAISLYALQRDEIALVLTDMMMPVMDGATLILALQRINPRVRVIAASGLKGNNDVARASSVGVKHFLPKPYSADTLLQLINQVLRGGGSRPPL